MSSSYSDEWVWVGEVSSLRSAGGARGEEACEGPGGVWAVLTSQSEDRPVAAGALNLNSFVPPCSENIEMESAQATVTAAVGDLRMRRCSGSKNWSSSS